MQQLGGGIHLLLLFRFVGARGRRWRIVGAGLGRHGLAEQDAGGEKIVQAQDWGPWSWLVDGRRRRINAAGFDDRYWPNSAFG
jgi:hypothetical protein